MNILALSPEDREYYSKLLDTWIGLNSVIMTSDEITTEKMLYTELAGRRRKQFVLRLHSRLNKLRADREREWLLTQVK